MIKAPSPTLTCIATLTFSIHTKVLIAHKKMESVKFINMNAKHSSIFLLAMIFVLILASANAKIHEHEFVVRSLTLFLFLNYFLGAYFFLV